MTLHALMFIEPPELSDENAVEMLDFLYQLCAAFENHYASQLRRYHLAQQHSQPDLFEDFDDPPDF